MSDILNAEWQNVAAIKSLLDSQGWKIFKEKVQSIRDSTACEIENQTSGFVSQEGVNRLNYLLAKRNTLDQILLLEDELIDDSENSPLDESVQNYSPDQSQMR